MTDVTRPVKRRTEALVRDEGKMRRLVITIYQNSTVGVRPEKTRREEIVTIASIYSLGVKQRVAKERAEKKARRK